MNSYGYRDPMTELRNKASSYRNSHRSLSNSKKGVPREMIEKTEKKLKGLLLKESKKYKVNKVKSLV